MMTRLGAYKSLEQADHDRCHLEMSVEALKAKNAVATGKDVGAGKADTAGKAAK